MAPRRLSCEACCVTIRQKSSLNIPKAVAALESAYDKLSGRPGAGAELTSFAKNKGLGGIAAFGCLAEAFQQLAEAGKGTEPVTRAASKPIDVLAGMAGCEVREFAELMYKDKIAQSKGNAAESESETYARLLQSDPRAAGQYYSLHADEIIEQRRLANEEAGEAFRRQQAALTASYQKGK